MMLFIKEFLPTIIVSGLIACPIAWIIMQHWLKNYAYRISITSYPFIISMLALTIVAVAVIALQTIKEETQISGSLNTE